MSHIPLLGEKIQSSKNILLINHIRMDPDAFGALSGLAQILHSLGKNVQAVNDSNSPEEFSFLGQNHLINPHLNIQEFKPELIISLDAASIDQLGKTYTNNKEIFESTDFFVIDHHISNPGFGQYNIIKTDYSSTCEIVYEIIEELGFIEHMSASIATCIFSGIITDTNIFYNQNTTPNTHRVAGELMKHGADFRAPITQFYKKKEFKASKLWGEILRGLQQIKIDLPTLPSINKGSTSCNEMERGDGFKKTQLTITYALVKQEYFDKTDTTDSDISGLVNEFLANIDGSDLCFLLYPLRTGKIKASFRSCEYDVSKLCQSFGGGGHKLAAGCSYDGNINDFRDEIINSISKIKSYHGL